MPEPAPTPSPPPSDPAEAGRDAPVPEASRVLELDVVRGVAILGILAVNMMLFAHPVHPSPAGPPGEGPLDAAARAAIALVAEAKFYPMFSLLFGIGAGLQLRRGEGAASRWRRRMIVLLGIGILHVLLLWWGDILTIYALLGLALPAFRGLSARRLVGLAAALLLVPLAVNALALGATELARSTPEGASALAEAAAETRASWREGHREATATYRGTDVVAMAGQRVRDWAFSTGGLVGSGLVAIVPATFLLGMAAVRSGAVRDLPRWRPRLRRIAVACAAFGAPANVAWFLLDGAGGPAGFLRLVLYVVGAPALSLAYAAGLAVLLDRPAWRARSRPIAAVGRTALSNYLLQSVVVTTIVHGYGAGLYGRLGPAAGLGLTLAIYALQVPASVAWLRRFRFGPVEWAWRGLAYGSRPPMRRARGPSA